MVERLKSFDNRWTLGLAVVWLVIFMGNAIWPLHRLYEIESLRFVVCAPGPESASVSVHEHRQEVRCSVLHGWGAYQVDGRSLSRMQSAAFALFQVSPE